MSKTKSIHWLLETSPFYKVNGYKIDAIEWIAFLYTSNTQLGNAVEEKTIGDGEKKSKIPKKKLDTEVLYFIKNQTLLGPIKRPLDRKTKYHKDVHFL